MHKQCIQFANGHCACAITPPVNASAEEMLHELGIQQPQALLLLIGAATLSAFMTSQITPLISQGIAPIVLSQQAMVIDGGTHTGVMALLGTSLAAFSNKTVLLGVAPAGLSTYPGGAVKEKAGKTASLDSLHTHFVLVPGKQWGDETNTMFALAQALSQVIPTMAILLNGGRIARKEAVQTVRHSWPLLVIEGSGRLADEIAHVWRQRPAIIPHVEMREIITRGRISLFPLTGSPADFQRHCTHLLLQQP